MTDQSSVARKASLTQVTIDRSMKKLEKRVHKSAGAWLAARRMEAGRLLNYYTSFGPPAEALQKRFQYPPDLGFTGENPAPQAEPEMLLLDTPLLTWTNSGSKGLSAYKPPYMSGSPSPAVITPGTDPFPGTGKIIEYSQALPAKGRLELLAMTWPEDTTAEYVYEDSCTRSVTASLYPTYFTVPPGWNRVVVTASYNAEGNSYFDAIPPSPPTGFGMVSVRLALLAVVLEGRSNGYDEAQYDLYTRFETGSNFHPGVQPIQASNGSLKVTLPALPGDRVWICFSATVMTMTHKDSAGGLVVACNLSHCSNIYKAAASSVTVPVVWITP